jgi:type VI secretion system secreted protein VgrG
MSDMHVQKHNAGSWRAVVTTGALLAVLVVIPGSAAAQIPNLSSAETFGVLAATITNTGVTTVAGDVGVRPTGDILGSPLTLTAGGVVHDGDAVAVQAQLDADEGYDLLAAMACTNNLSGQNLGGMTLAPGVYCFTADALLTGAPLTLTGLGPWIFRIAGNLTASAPVNVAGSTRTCNGSRVFWLVEDDATISGTPFVGSVIAETGDVTLVTGTDLDGRVIALDAASIVTLDANAVTVCSFDSFLPVHAAVKVTGGGQINVPTPTSGGFSNYGFNAKPEASGGASGHLNYLNHETRLHVNGTVTDLDVVTLNPDGSPDMVRFSGVCSGTPGCTFSVTVEDNGEPGRNDRFGIAVVGSGLDEWTPDRVVKNGNIQVHLGLTTTVSSTSFRVGDVMSVSVSLTPGVGSPRVDAYLVLRLPNGALLSWTGSGFAPGIVPMAVNVAPVNFRSVIARLTIPVGTPAGSYAWLSALTATGTGTLVSEIAEQRFTIR